MRFVRTLASTASLAVIVATTGCQNENDFRGKAVPPIAVIQPIESGPAYPGDEDLGIDPYYFEVDGQESYDPNSTSGNGIFDYEWTIESYPAGATADIGGGSTADFVTDTPGVYRIGLRVQDINDGVWSDLETRQLVAFPVSGFAATLTWSTDVDDIDLHLIHSSSMEGGGLFDENDCHFANLRPDWIPVGDPDGDPELNHDELDGHGPETIHMETPTVGQAYQVVVHYFSDDTFDHVSEATVNIFVNGEEVAEMDRELLANQVWDVGTFDWSGASGSFLPSDTISEY